MHKAPALCVLSLDAWMHGMHGCLSLCVWVTTPSSCTNHLPTGMLPTVILLSYFGSGLGTLESIGDFPSRCVC